MSAQVNDIEIEKAVAYFLARHVGSRKHKSRSANRLTRDSDVGHTAFVPCQERIALATVAQGVLSTADATLGNPPTESSIIRETFRKPVSKSCPPTDTHL